MTYTEKESPKPVTETKFPSFSIVYETENLASVELENIYRSLASLAAQDVSPEQANEFLIIDSGNAPAEVIEQLCSTYPWITVQRVPGISYYEAKMLGATLATGKIVVFCDSDCVYVSNWLRNLLTTFLQNSDINIVAGETSTPLRNPYELAIAMHYFFPRFSGREQPYESSYYFLNNVAFRRDFLLQNPIPTDLPLYRGNCSIHCDSLCKSGYKIWQHPQARATHEAPTISFSFWRYLLLGCDEVLYQRIEYRLTECSDITNHSQSSANLNLTFYQRIRSIASVVRRVRPFKWEQIRPVLREDPRRLIFFPIAVPIILWFELLYTIGSVTADLQPDWLLKHYREVESKPGEAASVAVSGFSPTK